MVPERGHKRECNVSATDNSDLIGCMFTKNCLYRIVEKCSGIDQLGRLNTVQSSDPVKDCVVKPVGLHVDGRRTEIPRINWQQIIRQESRCCLCSMTLPIVQQNVGLTENGGHFERKKCPICVVTPPTFSSLIFRN